MDSFKGRLRRAGPSDAEEIAAAHLDSIRLIGARHYPVEIVDDWAAKIRGALYVRAMQLGEVFYVAEGLVEGQGEILGFASHRVLASEHRTAVYVRGAAARRGIGSALFRLAESEAVAAGAQSIYVAASLAAVEFYKANGFDELGPGEHRLWSGRTMACLFMRKILNGDRTGDV